MAAVVRFANDQFTEHGTKGMLTDRGRLYIRFGEPDEIDRELMPTRDRQLDRLTSDLEQENPGARTLSSSDDRVLDCGQAGATLVSMGIERGRCSAPLVRVRSRAAACSKASTVRPMPSRRWTRGSQP